MRHWRLLPLAPRPYDDELTASWQERVASRYGRSIEELEQWLDPLCPGREAGCIERDLRPGPARIALWARACRLPASSIARMATRPDQRPFHWYVLDFARQGVCPLCLDEDHAQGCDHYRRRSWALAKTLVCPKHQTMLVDSCPRCHSLLGYRQHWAAGRGQMRCRACSAAVSTTIDEPMGSEWTAFLLRLTQAISEQIDEAGGPAADIDRAAKFLWAPRRSGEKPPMGWFAYGRKFDGAGTPADRTMPLATASLRWRVATFLAAAQLLDLADARDQLGEPPGFIVDAFAAQSRMRAIRPSNRPVEIAPMTQSSEPDDRRPTADYAEMARSILASPEWARARGSDRSRRNRLLGRLMTRALDQKRPVQAHGPGPAVP